MYIAASGSLKQEKMMDVVANNLANVNNNGFKRDLLAFEAVGPDFNANGKNTAGIPAHLKNSNMPGVLYPTVSTLKTDFSPGHIIQTGNSLDVALEGKGFFVVKTEDGPRYLRSGSFRLDNKREITTPEGNPIMGKNGPIKALPSTKDITINEKGQVIVGNGAGNTVVGQLKIVDFPDYSVLEKTGLGFFRETGPESEEPTVKAAENVKVIQGGLESANVNIATEMVSMIEVTRGYESYQKVIQTIDNLNSKVVNEVARIF